MTRDQGWEGSEHYRKLGLEPWDAMEHWFTPEEFKGFLKGCAVKRLARSHSKDEEILDITKAIHELQKALEIAKSMEIESFSGTENPIKGYSWALEQLEKGDKVRREAWDPGVYICRSEISGTKFLRNEAGVVVKLRPIDIAALDWEIHQ